ncbi:MAG: PKD domain-containing protein, partial [Acidobacteriota bacterium]
PFAAIGVEVEGQIRVAGGTGDDDFIGFALGFAPGDFSNPNADYLVLDWKQDPQVVDDNGLARKGLALSRVRGVPLPAELWAHADWSVNGPENGVDEIARQGFGGTGWRSSRTYTFRFVTAADRIQVWVDDDLTIDHAGEFAFGAGRMCFYNYSQAGVSYRSFTVTGLGAGEGTPVPLRLPFTDAGTGDSHTAVVDWGDGTVGPAAVEPTEGGGTVVGDHAYLDEGVYLAEACVEDDDGASDCGGAEVKVHNLPPAFELGPDRPAFVGDGLTLDVQFTDPGIVDTHTATVDWGDGTTEDLAAPSTAGAGTVTATHIYGAERPYDVELCIADDDGGVTCDTMTVTWTQPVLDLRIDAQADAPAVRQGSQMGYTLRASNRGTLAPTGVALTAELPTGFTVVDGAGGVYDGASHSLTWDLGTVARKETVEVRIVLGAPASGTVGEGFDLVAEVVDDGTQGPDATPADNSATVHVTLVDGVTPIPVLGALAAPVEGTVLAVSATIDDPEPAGGHTATVDWGDGDGPQQVDVTATPDGRVVSADHLYANEGTFTLELCVTDGAGRRGCDARPLEVRNGAPIVADASGVDLRRWRKEEYPGGQGSSEWVVDGDGSSVYQKRNSRPSIYYGDFPAFGSRLSGRSWIGPS